MREGVVYCSCCCKQVVDQRNCSPHDSRVTRALGAVADVNGIICGFCAKDLDENGLFPEERALAELDCGRA